MPTMAFRDASVPTGAECDRRSAFRSPGGSTRSTCTAPTRSASSEVRSPIRVARVIEQVYCISA